MIKIEYWNSYDICDVHYEDGYRNVMYLDVDVKKPQYLIDRETYENGLGEEMNVFIRWSKQYSFSIYCLEPLVDALTLITLHDNVWVQLDNGYSAKVKDFLAQPTWQEIDNVALVEVTFVTKSYPVSGHSAAGCI